MTARDPLFEGGDIETKIKGTGCDLVYQKLETCMGDNERDWRRCQKELAQFKKCMYSTQQGSEISVKR